MKKIFFLLLFFSLKTISQNPGFELLKKFNGVELYYKKKLVSEEKKKDVWLIEIEYFNNTSKDLFYKSNLVKVSEFDKKIGNKDYFVSHFTEIKIENVKNIFSDSNTRISGDITRLLTNLFEPIYIIKKGKTYTDKIQFYTEKGVEPIITTTIMNSIFFTDNIYDFL